MKRAISISISNQKKDNLKVILATVLVLLFVYTGLGKLIDHNVFAIQLNKQPLPNWSKPILVWMLPFLELGIVALLLSIRTRIWGFYFAFALLSVYTIYLGVAYSGIYGYVFCSCGKLFASMGYSLHLIVNLTLMGIAYIGIRLERIAIPPT